MIISASRRTDIPAFYSDWFYQRMKAAFVLVRNPMNPHQVSKVNLSPDHVDGIVLWTKNPIPMLDRLDEIKKYPYYFQFTLNAYGRDVEPNVPSKNDVMIPAFQKLSTRIGRERVVWRYDPIFLSERYTLDYHCTYFERLASRLSPYTDQCTVSFLDYYQDTERRMHPHHITGISTQKKLELMERMSEIALQYGLSLATCSERIDLSEFGIRHACCIDKKRLEKIGGYQLDVGKDKHQRPDCGCAASVDIGMYSTCPNGCIYCYANAGTKFVQRNFSRHVSSSPLVSGELTKEDTVKEREEQSTRNGQISLF